MPKTNRNKQTGKIVHKAPDASRARPKGGGELWRAIETRLPGAVLRELASRTGLSPYTLWRLRNGKPVRPTTEAKLRRWLEDPSGANAVANLRMALRATLGPLGARQTRQVESAVGLVIKEAFARQNREAPDELDTLGQIQR